MVYEIYFEPTVGQWRIRIITYLLCVVPIAKVVKMRMQDQPTTEPVHFDTYDEAVQYVSERGIDKAYLKRERIGHYGTWLNGQAAHATSA